MDHEAQLQAPARVLIMDIPSKESEAPAAPPPVERPPGWPPNRQYPPAGITYPVNPTSTLIWLVAFLPLLFLVVFTGSIQNLTFSPCDQRNHHLNRGYTWDCGEQDSYSFSVQDFRSFYSINLVSVPFPFWEAKMIDSIVNLVVGRGLQLIMFYFLVKVFAEVIHMIMKRASVRHDTFASVVLGTPDIYSMWYLCRDFFSSLQRHKIWFVCMMVSLWYVICHPLMINASTGYVALSDPYVQLEGNGLVPMNDFIKKWSDDPIIRIVDGDRLGMQPNELVSPAGDKRFYMALQDYAFYFYHCPQNGTWEPHCVPYIDLVNINGSIFDLTTFHPRLHVQTPYQVHGGNVYCEEDFLNIADNVKCLSSDTYGWGISLTMSFIALTLHMFWCVLIYGMHVCATKHIVDNPGESSTCIYPENRPRRLGVLRGEYDLGQLIQERLGERRAERSREAMLRKNLSGAKARLRYRSDTGDDGVVGDMIVAAV